MIKKPKAAKVKPERFDEFMRMVLEAPRQLEESMSIIGYLLHKTAGDVTIDLGEAERIRREYSVSVERNSDRPDIVRLKLYGKQL